MTPPKYRATAISTPDSELVGCPEPARVVLVMMCLRTALALVARSVRLGADATIRLRLGHGFRRTCSHYWTDAKSNQAQGQLAPVAVCSSHRAAPGQLTGSGPQKQTVARHFLHSSPRIGQREVLPVGPQRRQVAVVRAARLAGLPGRAGRHAAVPVGQVEEM